jgi:hypothetical protein
VCWKNPSEGACARAASSGYRTPCANCTIPSCSSLATIRGSRSGSWFKMWMAAFPLSSFMIHLSRTITLSPSRLRGFLRAIHIHHTSLSHLLDEGLHNRCRTSECDSTSMSHFDTCVHRTHRASTTRPMTSKQLPVPCRVLLKEAPVSVPGVYCTSLSGDLSFTWLTPCLELAAGS